MTNHPPAGPLGFLDSLARLLRPGGKPPPQQPQEHGFQKLEADFEAALRGLREKVAEQAALAGPGADEPGKANVSLAATRQRRMDECHRAIREDIEKMHARIGTGLSPAELDSIGALLERLAADAAEGKDSHSLLPHMRYSVGTRLRLESGALAVERLGTLMKNANLAWPDPIHHDPRATPEEIETSRRRRRSEMRESFLAQGFEKTAERMMGIVRAWGADYPDRGSSLWEESVLEGVMAGIRGRLLKDFVELVDRDQDVLVKRMEAAIGKEIAALHTAMAGGVYSLEQANEIALGSLHALDTVVPELVWQHVRSSLPRARADFPR